MKKQWASTSIEIVALLSLVCIFFFVFFGEHTLILVTHSGSGVRDLIPKMPMERLVGLAGMFLVTLAAYTWSIILGNPLMGKCSRMVFVALTAVLYVELGLHYGTWWRSLILIMAVVTVINPYFYAWLVKRRGA